MTEVIGVRFKQAGKVFYFDPDGHEVRLGDKLVVETVRGAEIGECAMELTAVEDDKVVSPLKKILRPADERDLEAVRKNRRKGAEALEICQKEADSLALEMKIVDAEYTFDGGKLTFYFIAEGRVDFRTLVKNLASIFRTRIELRQIGVRDEAKILGGLGACGRPFCCNTFLDEFHPVSIKMAKEQNLSLNPTKISGSCGRLMCCLKYEQEAYGFLHKQTPSVESLVQTPEGEGTIVDVSLLRRQLKVRLDSQPDAPIKTFHVDDVKVLRRGRQKKEK